MHWETKKIYVTQFIAVFALLRWPGIKPTVYLRYACIQLKVEGKEKNKRKTCKH